jgi:hypothetical protein
VKGRLVDFVPRAITHRLMLLACVIALASMTAFADNISFSGSGDNGTLAPGVPFSYDSFGSVPEGNWGIPGVGDGDVPWSGSASISEFDIAFALPAGTAIDPAEVAVGNGGDCRGNSADGTTFCAGSSSVPWRRIEKKKIEEAQEEIAQVHWLVARYLPLSREALQQAFQTNRIDVEHGGDQGNSIVIHDFAKQGDTLSFHLNLATMDLRSIGVRSYLDSPSDVLTADVQFAVLPDGTHYPGVTTINAPGKRISITAVQSDFSKTVQ